MADNVSALVGPILGAGVLGPIVVIMGYYIRQLQRQLVDQAEGHALELRELGDTRVAEAKASAEVLLTLSQAHNEQSADVVKTMTESTQAMTSLREAVRDALPRGRRGE